MTRKDCEQQGLQYYDVRPKKDGKDEEARTMSNSEPQSARRGSDSSSDVELFGPIWDNIDCKYGVAERSDERACEPGVENFTSESE
jgi:hypothetical protein